MMDTVVQDLRYSLRTLRNKLRAQREAQARAAGGQALPITETDEAAA